LGISVRLENARLFLQPAHVFDDLIDIVRFDGHDLRHVAELPMMCPDPIGCGPVEGGVAMMIGLVDPVHQRRTLGSSDTPGSMTGRTIGRELLLAPPEIGRNRRSRAFRLRFALATSRCRAEHKRDETDPHRARNLHEVISLTGE